MKTIILMSKALNQFLVFETDKSPNDLVEHLQGKEFVAEQAKIKELLFSSDLTAEISGKYTYKSNQQAERFKAVTKMEKAGLVYLGTNRGESPEQGVSVIDATASEPDDVSGLSLPTSIFIGVNQFVFWLLIAASVLVGMFGDPMAGIILGFGTILGFGLLFMLSDLLKNTVEINRKLSESPREQ